MHNGSQVSITTTIEEAVRAQVPEATVQVASAGGGHFSLVVTSPAFRGRSMLENHRLVYAAIAPLMAGDSAPVHAIDSLRTIAG